MQLFSATFISISQNVNASVHIKRAVIVFYFKV